MKLKISRFVGMESFLSLEALSVAHELLDSISSTKENMVYANEGSRQQPCDLRRHLLPLSITGHDGAKVSFVHQNRQYILVHDEASQGFDACFFDS